jgi:hypothetical protein
MASPIKPPKTTMEFIALVGLLGSVAIAAVTALALFAKQPQGSLGIVLVGLLATMGLSAAAHTMAEKKPPNVTLPGIALSLNSCWFALQMWSLWTRAGQSNAIDWTLDLPILIIAAANAITFTAFMTAQRRKMQKNK